MKNIINPLQTLPQYHFDRHEMCDLFDEVFTTDQFIDVDVACGCSRNTDSFALFRGDDEFYILHKDSGVLINWYKHLGRTNTCNKEDFTLDNLRVFLVLLKDELLEYDHIDKDEPDSYVWRPCSYGQYEWKELKHDGSWIPGRKYEWLDEYGNRVIACMRNDAGDYFDPPAEMDENDIIAFRVLKGEQNGENN